MIYNVVNWTIHEDLSPVMTHRTFCSLYFLIYLRSWCVCVCLIVRIVRLIGWIQDHGNGVLNEDRQQNGETYGRTVKLSSVE